MYPIRIVNAPFVEVAAQSELYQPGIQRIQAFVREYHPDCTADGELPLLYSPGARSGIEALPEICGRGCYYSYGVKMGRKTNQDYVKNIVDIRHASVMYHGKITFFIANISRRVGEELLRHYVGADRSMEGSPSKESTRYTEHPGVFVRAPFEATDASSFETACQQSYTAYRTVIQTEVDAYLSKHGKQPTGLARKRIYEYAAGYLGLQAACSLYFTVNAVSVTKLIKERCNAVTGEMDPSHPADLEFQRLALTLREICRSQWPNVFQPLLA